MICFGKMPLKGGGFGAFEIFCCLARIGISLTTVGDPFMKTNFRKKSHNAEKN